MKTQLVVGGLGAVALAAAGWLLFDAHEQRHGLQDELKAARESRERDRDRDWDREEGERAAARKRLLDQKGEADRQLVAARGEGERKLAALRTEGERKLAAARLEGQAEAARLKKQLDVALAPRPNSKPVDALRVKWQERRHGENLAEAHRLLNGEPDRGRAMLESIDLFPPERRDEAWLTAWRQAERRLVSVPGKYYSAVFSGDGNRLALAQWPVSGRHLVRILDVQRCREVRALEIPEKATQLLLSADGSHLAIRLAGRLQIGAVQSGRVADVKSSPGDGGLLGFNAAGDLISVEGQLITHRKPDTGEMTAYSPAPGPAAALLYRGGRELVFVARAPAAFPRQTGSLRVFDVFTGKESRPAVPLQDLPEADVREVRATGPGLLVVTGPARGWPNGTLTQYSSHHGDKMAHQQAIPSGAWAVSRGGWSIVYRTFDGQGVISRRYLSRPHDGAPLFTGQYASSLALSPGGSMLASLGPDGACLWSVGPPTTTRTFTVAVPPGASAVLAPAGRTLALWTPDRIDLHDLDGRAIRHTVEEKGNKIIEVRFSWDGRLLLARRADGVLSIWDVADGKRRGQIDKPGSLGALVFLPGDGGLLAVSHGSLRRWGLDGKALGQHALPGGTVRAARDGTVVAVLSGKEVRLFDPKSGKETAKLPAATLPVTDLRIADDGKRLFGLHGNEQVSVWDVGADRPRLLACQTQKGNRLSMESRRSWDVSPDGRWLVTASTFGRVAVWDATAGKVVGHHFSVSEWNEQITESKFGFSVRATGTGRRMYALRFLDDSRHLFHMAGKDFGPAGQADLWSIAGRSSPNVTLEASGHRWAQASRDGSILAQQAGNVVRVWDRQAGLPRAVLTGHLAGVRGLAFSPDGQRLYTAGEDGTVREWDAAVGRCLRTFDDFAAGVLALALAPDGQALYTLEEGGRVLRRDLGTGLAFPLLQGSKTANHLYLTPDGRALLVGPDQRMALMRYAVADGKADGKPLLVGHERRFALHPRRTEVAMIGGRAMEVASRILMAGSHIYAAVYSPDGEALLAVTSDAVEVWDPGKRVRVRSWPLAMTAIVPRAEYAPAGKAVAIAAGRSVTLWDPTRGVLIAGLPGHLDAVDALAFSPDGRTLATADRAGVVRVWNVGFARRGVEE